MNATKFKRQAETLIQGLRHLIRKMPQKGDTPEECQRTALQVALNVLAHTVHAVKDADFIKNDNHEQ